MIKRIARGVVAIGFCSAIFMSAAPATLAASGQANAHSSHPSHQKHQPQTSSETHQSNSSRPQSQTATHQNGAPSHESAPAASQSSYSTKSQAGSSSVPAVNYAVVHSSSTKTASTIPGNNGTVKIHATAGNASPRNQPHVGCNFFVDYYHYDLNDMLSTTFAAHPPSGTGQLGSADAFTITSLGSKGFNTERPYDLSSYLSGLQYNSQQGYHVKLSVANQSAPGGDKHKVFWINCQQPPTGGQGGGGGTTTPPTNTPPTTTPPTTTTGGHGGGVVLTSSSQPTGGQGAGNVLPANTSGSSIASLPYTGAHDGLSVWIAILAILGLSSAIYWRQAIMPLLRR